MPEVQQTSLQSAGALLISNGNRTEWSPIRSVIIHTRSSDLFMHLSMLSPRVGGGGAGRPRGI